MLLGTVLVVVLAVSARADCEPGTEKVSPVPNVNIPGYILPFPGPPFPYPGFLDQRFFFSALQVLNFQVQELQRQQVLLLTALQCAKISVLPNEACQNPPFDPQPTISTTTTPEATTTTSTTTTTTTANPEEFSNEGEDTIEVVEVPYPSYVNNKDYDLYISPEQSRPSGQVQGHLEIKLPSFDLFGRLGRGVDADVTGVHSAASVNNQQTDTHFSNPESPVREQQPVSNPEVAVHEEYTASNPEISVQEQQPVSNPEVVVHEEHPASNPEVLVQQQHPVSSPEVVVHEEHPASNPEVLVQQQHPVSNPEYLVQEQHAVSNPEVVAHEEYPASNPEISVQEQHPISNPEVLVQGEYLASVPEVVDENENSNNNPQVVVEA